MTEPQLDRLQFLELKSNNNYDVCAYTCIGGRNEDQDAFAMPITDKILVLTVCDGMGGAAGGCVASTTAAKAITDYFEKNNNGLETVEEMMVSAIKSANATVFNKSKEEPRLRGMGTTVTLLVINDYAAYAARIGDSRIYQLRKGKKIFRTFDQSRVFERVKMGRITEEQARTAPDSNILTMAVGIMPEIEVEVEKLSYNEGDRFVLCCDGVWNSLPEPELIEKLSERKNPKVMVKKIQAMVEEIGQKNGGHHDNHTMIMADIKIDSQYYPTIFTKLFKYISSKCNNKLIRK